MTDQRTALVTNASDFAGPAAVDGLLNAGYRVLAHDRVFADNEVWAAYAQTRPDLERVAASEPEAVIAEVFERVERLDALISNDHYPARLVASDTLPTAELRANLERLVVDPFVLIGAAMAHFRQQGEGRVVMITSNRTHLPMKGGAVPDAARAAQNALVKSLALELAEINVALNAIAPNFLYSEAYYPKAVFEHTEAGRDYVRDSVPVGRLGKPEEMSELIVFLAGAQSKFMTGAIIDWSGGWPMGVPRPA